MPEWTSTGCKSIVEVNFSTLVSSRRIRSAPRLQKMFTFLGPVSFFFFFEDLKDKQGDKNQKVSYSSFRI